MHTSALSSAGLCLVVVVARLGLKYPVTSDAVLQSLLLDVRSQIELHQNGVPSRAELDQAAHTILTVCSA